MLVQMRWIKLVIIVISLSAGSAQAQMSWMGKTKLTVSYYHIGSYSKERPLVFLDQSFEMVIKPQFRIGLGTGVNLYPSDLTVPLFMNLKYVKEMGKIGFFAQQSYGVNLKLGSIGFFSHRLVGGAGVMIRLKDRLTLDPELGYVLNLDNYGGGSLSFTTSLGVYYTIGK